MLVVRQAYNCDCDGVSHETSLIGAAADQLSMRGSVQAHLSAIESVVGVRPETCPWRALYHPLVLEVVQVCALAEQGLAAAKTGSDPPAILLDAVVAYTSARSRALSHNLEQQRKEHAPK